MRPLPSTGRASPLLPSYLAHLFYRLLPSAGHMYLCFPSRGLPISISCATGWTHILPSPTSSLIHHICVPKHSKHQPAPVLSDATFCPTTHSSIHSHKRSKGRPSPPSPISPNTSNTDLSCYARYGMAVLPVPRYDLKPCSGLARLSIYYTAIHTPCLPAECLAFFSRAATIDSTHARESWMRRVCADTCKSPSRDAFYPPPFARGSPLLIESPAFPPRGAGIWSVVDRQI